MGQLAKRMAEKPTSSFGANTEKNPKEECKVVLTRSQRKAQGDQSKEGRADKEGEKEEEEKKVLTFKTKSQRAK